MSDIYSLMVNYITGHKMLKEGESILAAVSGGADSMCMLCLLIRYAKDHGNKLGVISVDHGFRTEAAAEAEYVYNFSKSNGLPVYIRKIEPGTCGKSEEAARIRRYELICETASAEGYDHIALAHNEQDRAETMLFNMFRGSGILGLTGIRPVRDMFIRPIMCLGRDEIEGYLKDNNIVYFTDRTNLEDDYARNRIRHHIIPEALSVNEGSVRHMNSLADDIYEIYEYIDDQTVDVYERIVKADEDSGIYTVKCDEYVSLSKVLRMGILRRIIYKMSPHLKDISREHLESADRLVFKENGARADLPYGIRVYKEYDLLRIVPGSGPNEKAGQVPEAAQGEELCVEIDIRDLKADGSPVSIDTGSGSRLKISLFKADKVSMDDIALAHNSYTKLFDYDKINKLFTLRFRETEDQIIIDPAGHKKALSRYMIEAKIPNRIRGEIPLIADGNNVIWLIGYRDSYAYRIDESTKLILELKLEVDNGRTS